MANRHLKKRKKNKGRVYVALVVCLLAGAMCVRMVGLYHKDEEYKQKEEQLAEQIESETSRQQQLEEYQKYVQSDEYVEEIAKTKLGLLFKNEIVFKEAGD